MYNEYFGLEEAPFSITPDPRYLYMSEQHREALAHLIYGFNSNGGFVLLTGDIGTGKTTVCRCLLEQAPENSSIAFILNPKVNAEELLATICDEFRLQYPAGNTSIKVFIDLINDFLLDAHSKGRKAVLIIDEAQNLSTDVLEQLRLLTNLETNQHKLLQIILLGQPELRDKLARDDLRQLSQRIVARFHLGHLTKNDISAYISHRLAVAGVKKQLFPASTMKRLFQLSKGVPRLINVLCDRSLLGAFTQNRETVNSSILNSAAAEVFGKNSEYNQKKNIYAWGLSLLLILTAVTVIYTSYYGKSTETAAEESTENTAPAKAVAAPSDKTDILKLPAGTTTPKSRQTAFKSLLNLWGIEYIPADNATACDFALSRGLWCEHDRGSLRSLVMLDRPAVLKLFGDEGRSFYITLRSIDGETAGIILNNETMKVSLNEIKSKWLGDYSYIWQPPAGYVYDIKPGTDSPLVEWLKEQMNRIYQNDGPSDTGTVYDEKLEKMIKRFQSEKGLVPDGIVGTRTLIHINTAVMENIPTLKQKQEKI